MKKTLSFIALLSLIAQCSFAQITPDISSWIRNTTGATGYNGIPSDVQSVSYTATDVYVSATCIPGYSIGPWTNNPNIPVNENFVFKITRNPVQNTGTATTVGLGHTGVWSNGVSVFNVSDGQSYNNQGVWHRNAYFWEGISFDNCLGHPAPNGEYHHHVNPTCLYNDADSLNHSPIIGYAFDGFPIYGAYAYTNTNGTGPIKRMQSGYAIANPGATTRTNGPAVNANYPLGCFMEDWTFAGTGDLDLHNGRFCITPEYPAGTYAYFVTIDATLTPVFPYTMYLSYYGVVQPGNTGPNGGHNTIPGNATLYNGSVGISETTPEINYSLSPNPVTDFTMLSLDKSSSKNVELKIYNAQGAEIKSSQLLRSGNNYQLDFTSFTAGVYFIHLSTENKSIVQKIVKL